MKALNVTVAVFCMLVGGCGGGQDEQAAEQETVFDPLVGTLDRAKDVAVQVEGRDEDINKKLDEIEDSDR